ncbi:MAG TPA: DUF6401 family natural product biosynthesis protein [Pseudonocardiaceae bacterium]|nr:DUF6401 family natural product biosynthesis protein [Pseudonocardiaceae bacterium]
MLGLPAAWTELSARRLLTQLHDQFGTTGLAAASAVPALTAVLDQHSAAVRDILMAGVEGSAAVAGVVLLAGYARGLLAQGAAIGWQFAGSGDSAEWARADWLSVRLLSVCALARSVDGPAPSVGAGRVEYGY